MHGEKGPAVVALVELAGRRVSKSAKRKGTAGPPWSAWPGDGRALTSTSP